MSDSDPLPESVDESELDIAHAPATSGGNADILRCTWRGRAYIYKRFMPEFVATLDRTALTRMVRWRRTMEPATRRRLDRVAAWPLSVVRRGDVTGVLIEVAPPHFLLPDGNDGRIVARTLSKLPLLEADLRDEQAPQAVPAVLGALGSAALVLMWLHDLKVVVNDVQPDNVLTDVHGGRVYLVDCDSMMHPAWGAVAPSSAPAYLNDVLPHPPGAAVDLAKLAWCAYFLLLRDFSPRSLGPDLQRAVARFMPSATARLLALAATTVDDAPVWRRFWSERANLWITANRAGTMVTDDGIQTVTGPAPVPAADVRRQGRRLAPVPSARATDLPPWIIRIRPESPPLPEPKPKPKPEPEPDLLRSAEDRLVRRSALVALALITTIAIYVLFLR